MATLPRSVIIGGGVVGLACAHALSKRGHHVTVVERGTLGEGCSFGNAGWIVPSFSAPIPAPGLTRRALGWTLQADSAFRLRLRAAPWLAGWLWQFRRHCNQDDHARGTQALAQLNRMTLACFDALVRDGVRFEMHRRGVLFAFLGERALQATRAQLCKLATYGFGEPVLLRGDALHAAQPGLGRQVCGGLLMAGERHVRPDSLTGGLVVHLRASGAELRERTQVQGWQVRDGRIEGVRTEAGLLTGDCFVLAAGVDSGRLASMLGVNLPVESGIGYSLSYDTASPLRQPLDLAEVGVVCSPFTQGWRIAGILELSGLDGRPDPRRLQTLRKAAMRYLDISQESVDGGRPWMGQRPLTPDGLPAIGRLPGQANGYVATGHAMLGITLAPVTAELIADLVTQGWTEAGTSSFDPGRFAGWRASSISPARVASDARSSVHPDASL